MPAPGRRRSGRTARRYGEAGSARQALHGKERRRSVPGASTHAGTVSGSELIWGELMRLEGYHVVVLLVLVLTAAAVVVGVTFLVRWALRLGRKQEGDGNAGAPHS